MARSECLRARRAPLEGELVDAAMACDRERRSGDLPLAGRLVTIRWGEHDAPSFDLAPGQLLRPPDRQVARSQLPRQAAPIRPTSPVANSRRGTQPARWARSRGSESTVEGPRRAEQARELGADTGIPVDQRAIAVEGSPATTIHVLRIRRKPGAPLCLITVAASRPAHAAAQASGVSCEWSSSCAR